MTGLPPPWTPKGPLADEVDALAKELDLPGEAAELDRAPRVPRKLFAELGRRGLLGLTVPTELGGRGLPLPEAGATLYALAHRSGSTVVPKLALQPEFSSVLAEHGPAGLVDEWYRPLCRGAVLVGNQVTEPNAGSDAGAMEAVATPDGADGYRLSGTKSEIAFAADADAAIVYARVPTHPGGPGGITAFLVPQRDDGIERTVVPDLGERWMRRGSVTYRNVLVPTGHRLGAEGDGLRNVLREIHRERALLAMIYLGIARTTLEGTSEHVGRRLAFGTPLARQEAVSFPLAEDWADGEAAALYAREVLRRRAAGERVDAEAGLAKRMATAVALRTLDHAIQFHGGRGYSAALPFERRFRDVRSGALAHGSSELMLSAAARRIWPPSRASAGPSD